MWTAVKHNNSKHLRRQDSGIFDKVHAYRCAVGGGAVEGFFISHRCGPPKKRVDWSSDLEDAHWVSEMRSSLFMHKLQRSLASEL